MTGRQLNVGPRKSGVRFDNHSQGVVTPSCGCGPTRSRITERMKKISYSGYRFPPEIIHQAIWLYLRFTLSLRDVEDLLAERGVPVSYETVRRWVNHFGPMIAADLRKRRMKPHTTWHLDEVYLKIDGRMVYLWRAVDAEGSVAHQLKNGRTPQGRCHPEDASAQYLPPYATGVHCVKSQRQSAPPNRASGGAPTPPAAP
jgi:DDE domain